MMIYAMQVIALENYNLMVDSELTRTRSEVIKMDDKVSDSDIIGE